MPKGRSGKVTMTMRVSGGSPSPLRESVRKEAMKLIRGLSEPSDVLYDRAREIINGLVTGEIKTPPSAAP